MLTKLFSKRSIIPFALGVTFGAVAVGAGISAISNRDQLLQRNCQYDPRAPETNSLLESFFCGRPYRTMPNPDLSPTH